MNVEQAKQVLTDAGFYVENLWSIQDVQAIFKCDDETAQNILDKSLTNEATMQQIHFSIREFGTMNNLDEVN